MEVRQLELPPTTSRSSAKSVNSEGDGPCMLLGGPEGK